MKTLVIKFLIVAIPFILFNCQTKEVDQVKPSLKEELKITISKVPESSSSSSSNAREEYVIPSPIVTNSYLAGDTIFIAWITGGSTWTSTNINIDLFKGNFAVTRIASNISVSPNYLYWVIPTLVQYGNDFKIRISDPNDANNKYSYSPIFSITSGTPITKIADVALYESRPVYNRTYRVSSFPISGCNLNYILRVKYNDNSTSEIHQNIDSNPLAPKTTDFTFNTNIKNANRDMIFEIVHNGVVVNSIKKRLYRS